MPQPPRQALFRLSISGGPKERQDRGGKKARSQGDVGDDPATSRLRPTDVNQEVTHHKIEELRYRAEHFSLRTVHKPGEWHAKKQERRAKQGGGNARREKGRVIAASGEPSDARPEPRCDDGYQNDASIGKRFRFHLTSELSDAGGPVRPHWQVTSPARVRSSDLVRLHRLSCQYPTSIHRPNLRPTSSN